MVYGQIPRYGELFLSNHLYPTFLEFKLTGLQGDVMKEYNVSKTLS